MAVIFSVRSVHAGLASPFEAPARFEQAEITVGRSPKNDIVLPAPDVSGSHAKFVLTPPRNGSLPKLTITDVGSSNGTFVEEKQIKQNSETEVNPGQRIIIGGYVLSFDFDVQDVLQATADSDTVRYQQELRIKREIHERLLVQLDLRRRDIIELSDEDLRKRARHVIENILIDLRWHIPDGMKRDRLIDEILDEALGLGPLEDLIASDGVSEIMVNAYDQIYAEREGKLELTKYRFSSEHSVLAAIERILAPIGRRIDEASPLVDARLKDGSRVNAVIRPLALRGPCITIRKFAKTPLTIQDLVRFRAMSQGMADFLKLAVHNRKNVVISGGTGSGKTTLLNVISGFIPPGERVITVEDAAELQLTQEHVVRFETKPPNLEGKGAITIRDLVRNALRMRPDRIIVGECRGAEALDMLQAMNTGHDGSMTTGHSNSPEDMVRRMETMVLMAGMDLPVRAIREQIASAVDIILQQTRFGCGTRKVTAISEVVGLDMDEGTVILQDIFLFKQEGYGKDGKIRGFHQATGYIPKFFRLMQERGLQVDASVFNPDTSGPNAA